MNRKIENSIIVIIVCVLIQAVCVSLIAYKILNKKHKTEQKINK